MYSSCRRTLVDLVAVRSRVGKTLRATSATTWFGSSCMAAVTLLPEVQSSYMASEGMLDQKMVMGVVVKDRDGESVALSQVYEPCGGCDQK